jgi:hypothetical protein
MTLTASRLRELFDYDPESGEFIRRIRAGNYPAGAIVIGTVEPKNGYRVMSVDNQTYKAHRLAWFHVHGEWPPCVIDHCDGNVQNNRISNLRAASFSQNAANRKAHSSLGLKGVRFENGRFKAIIRDNKRTRHLGVFDTAEDANQAYLLEAKKLHGEFARRA